MILMGRLRRNTVVGLLAVDFYSGVTSRRCCIHIRPIRSKTRNEMVIGGRLRRITAGSLLAVDFYSGVTSRRCCIHIRPIRSKTRNEREKRTIYGCAKVTF